MVKKSTNDIHVIIEKDADGVFVGSVPELPGCHSQAKSLDELIARIKEAAELCLEGNGGLTNGHEFVGVQKLSLR